MAARTPKPSLLDQAEFERRVRAALGETRTSKPRKRPRKRPRTLREIMIDAIVEALDDNDWNVAAAAHQLDVARSSVFRLIKRHRLRRRA